MATTAVSPQSNNGNSTLTFALTGTTTAWVNGVTVFSITGVAGCTITSQTVNSTTSASITVSFGTAIGTLTVSNNTDASTTTITVVNWQQLVDDTFHRANTSVGGAGSQSGILNNWIDYAGNIWSINNNQLKGVGGGSPGIPALRPTSESIATQRVVITKVATTSNQTLGIVLRFQGDTSRYYLSQGAQVFRINRVSNANVVSFLTNDALPTGPVVGDLFSLDFSVVNIGGSPYLTAVYTNYTTGITLTSQILDVNAAKITGAGQCGVDLSVAGTFTINEVQTYYNNTASAVLSPTGSGSGITNQNLSLVGTNTNWTGATTLTLTASGANGAALGTLTFVDSTHLNVVLSNSGSVSDSLVITDNTSGTTTQFAVTAPTMSISPTSVNASTSGNVLTITGNIQKWTTSAPSFSISGVAGITITNTTVINDTKATITITTGSATGTATLTDATYAASNTFVVNFVIPLNDSNIILSPYNWNLNSNIYADANYAGAYAKINFTTTASSPLLINYDPAPNIAGGLAAGNYPTIAYSLNPTRTGGKWTKVQLTSTSTGITISSNLAAGTYQLEIYVVNIRGGTDGGRWNPSCRKVRLTGIQMDGSGITNAITRRTKNAIMYGDSITQGVGTIAVSSSAGDDAWQGWVKAVGDGMDAEYGNIGMAGQQWGGSITSIPAFYLSTNTPPDTYTYQEAGISRLVAGKLSPIPDYVFINMGTNDGTSNIKNNVTSTITGMRAICNAATKIFLVLPFGGYEQSATTGIPAGYNAYVAANPSDTYVFLLSPGNDIAPVAGLNNSTSSTENQYAFDGLHPKNFVSMAYGARITLQAQLAIDSTSGGGGTANNVYILDSGEYVHVLGNQKTGITI